MALITRCPVCGTRFKVVPDQMRISDGWVRCGECAEVFDASVDLTQSDAEPVLAPLHGDVASFIEPRPMDSFVPAPEPLADTWAPAPQNPPDGGLAEDIGDSNTYGTGYGTGYVWSAPPQAEPAPAPAHFDTPFQPAFDTLSLPPVEAPAHSHERFARDSDDAMPTDDLGPALTPWDPTFDDLIDDTTEEAPDEPKVDAQGKGQDGDDEVPQSLTEFPSDMSTLPEDTLYVAPPPPAAVEAALDERPVSFLKQPPEQAVETIWQRSWVRRGLAALGGLLLLTLGVQAAVQQRDHIAASLPGAKPVLQALCAPFGCTVEPLRQIESIVIDSSTFTTVRHGVYRLNVVLKNRAASEIAVPAIELALTDTQEQAVLRRVLQPGDMAAAPGNIAPHGEWTASMELAVTEEASISRIVGYRLLAFYP